MRNEADSTLMKLYADGSSDAFQELFRRFEGRAFAYFLRRTRSRERASDLYQELFLRLHRFRDRYDPQLPFAPWFFRVAHRVWLDEVRRSYRSREVPTDSAPEAVGEWCNAERQAIDREETQQLLGQLPADQASVVVAAKLGGMDYARIALDLGKSLDATKQLGSRGLRRMRSLAGKPG